MNRKFVSTLSCLLLTAVTTLAQPAQTWVNFGVLTSPTNIDAVNVINSNTINLFLLGGLNPQLFDTSDTLNFTNVGSMTCDAGWRFDTAPAIQGIRKPAKTLFNSGTITAGFTLPVINPGLNGDITIFTAGFTLGDPKIIASADNIINTGTMDVGTDGLLKLTGNSIRVGSTALTMEGQGSGIFDNYWMGGANGTNVLNPSRAFTDFFVQTPVFDTTNFLGNTYSPGAAQVAFQPTAVYTNIITFGTNTLVQAVAISQLNPAISNNVYFEGNQIGVEWIAYGTNPVTGVVVTNYLNALDVYTDPPVTNNNLRINHTYPNGIATYAPTNFSLTLGRFFGPFDLPFLAQPGGFSGLFAPGSVTNQFNAYDALIRPFTAPTNDTAGRVVTNLVGRVELTSSGLLDLNRTRIGNPNVVSLKATENFAGNVNAQIASAFWDMDIGSQNSTLTITNLLMPLIRINGEVQFYRARWTNGLVSGVGTNGVTNNVIYNILLVDSFLENIATPQINDFYLRNNRNTDVVISDRVDVMRNFQINALNLTLTSNDTQTSTYPLAFYPSGQLNFQNDSILWPFMLPNLQNLTNFGSITLANAGFFGAQVNGPYGGSGPGNWYQSFVNDGLITAQGLTINANYLENGGVLDSGFGPITINAQNANIINGTLSAPASSVSIGSGVLLTSNAFMAIGTSLTLSVTNLLDDGSLTNCVQFVTNKNIWAVSNGFNLLNLPPLASLAATTVTNSAAAFSQNLNTWAGRDLGPDPAGFINNAAIGRLVLNGAHPDSLFTFIPANGNNALYVDDLQFVEYATNVNLNGDFIGLSIPPGMKIYFGQAEIIIGTNSFSVAKKIAEDHSNGGGLVWVSNYHCGFFSSTNLIDPVSGQAYTMNTALRNACDIDSDGDGLPNCIDPTPLGSNLPSCPCPQFSYSPSIIPPYGDDSSGSPAASYLRFPSPTGIATNPIINKTFAQVKGAYYGLFAEPNVCPASSGFVSVSAAANGTFSAKILLGSTTYSTSGRFNSSGIARTKIARGRLPALNVALQIDLNGGGQVRGTVSAGTNWTARLLADRAAFDPTVSPARDFAGSYTVNLPGDAPDSGRPAGDGFATLTVDSGGKIVVAGAFGDGSALARNTALSSQGRFPIYASLYTNAGCALGWLQISNHTVGGQVIWMKPAALTGALAKSYPQGFTNRIATAGVPWRMPPAGTPALGWRAGSVILSGGGLASLFTNSIVVNGLNQLVTSADPSFRLTIVPSAGTFSGSISNSADVMNFRGAIFQDMNVGYGYFLNSGQSGQIYLGPPQ